MSVQAAALVLAWAAIVLLTLGFAYNQRLVLTLVDKREQGDLRPRLLRNGVKLSLPTAVRGDRTQWTIVLFGSTTCRSCMSLARALHHCAPFEDPAGQPVRVVFLWQGRAPSWLLEAGADCEESSPLFDQLAVRLTPTLAVVSPNETVAAVSTVGSLEDVNDLLLQIGGKSSPSLLPDEQGAHHGHRN